MIEVLIFLGQFVLALFAIRVLFFMFWWINAYFGIEIANHKTEDSAYIDDLIIQVYGNN